MCRDSLVKYSAEYIPMTGSTVKGWGEDQPQQPEASTK